MNFHKLFEAAQSGNRDAFFNVLKENIPCKLYKYVCLDGSQNDDLKFLSLEQNSLWISNIKAFNDPFEFKGIILDKRKFKEYGYSDEVIQKYSNSIDFSEEYGVCCLSNTTTSCLPMWAYYANAHQGFCIEYEILNKDHIFEVLYEERRIKIFNSFCELASELNKLASNNSSFDEKKANSSGLMLFTKMLIKSNNWSHEKEFRIIYPLNNNSGENISIDLLGLKVIKIIGGYNCSIENINKLNKISKRITGSNAYKIVISETDFATIEQIVE